MRLQILRHAHPLTNGRLAGRLDVDADCHDSAAFTYIRNRIGKAGQVISSPAKRCLQTAEALGFSHPETYPDLWEQDYGDWEGKLYTDLPDLGALPAAELAPYRPAGGESFDDMAARVIPVLQALESDTLIAAHAGTVRAALSMVVGANALSFSVAPLSLTILRKSGADWAIETVNLTAPGA